MAKSIRIILIVFLLLELAAAVYPLKAEVKIKNNLAAWPRLLFAQTPAELIINTPRLLRQDISSWEKVLTEENEPRDALLKLALLHYQLYENDEAKYYWERAYYLDPTFVSSLPCPLPACPPPL